MGAPKLLPKRLVTAEVATQKAHDIKRGLELAKKIDALRETKVEEEGNLDKFRAQSIASVQRSIDAKVKELETIEREIRVKEAKSAAITPSLEEQWRQIRESKDALEKKKLLLASKETDLQRAVSLNIQRERANEDERQRIDVERSRTSKELQVATDAKEDAIKDLQRARSQSQEIIREAQEREQAVSIREHKVNDKEDAVNLRATANEDWEVDLSNRERALKDRYETLERTIKRLKK